MDLRHSEAAPTTGALPLKAVMTRLARCPSSDTSRRLLIVHGHWCLYSGLPTWCCTSSTKTQYVFDASVKDFDVKSVRFTGLLTEHGL